MQTVFENIYKNNSWSVDGDGSGPGSEPKFTIGLRTALKQVIRDKNIHVMLDAACGSCKWTSIFLQELNNSKGPTLTYIGVDATETAVERARRNLQRVDGHFVSVTQGDIATCMLPQCDLVLCRDCLQHLSYENINKVITNLHCTGAKWFLFGSYKNNPNSNKNIADGDYFDIDLNSPPFDMMPDEIFVESNIHGHPRKHLYLYSNETLAKYLNTHAFFKPHPSPTMCTRKGITF